jgi:3-carboxy-cis,cis-muconate cycloisomerase
VALMAQSEVAAIRLDSGGSSSSMPHKVNPVGAEVLVALAHYNAVLLSGLHVAMVHENERSGAAWTLEWLTLPQMLRNAGGALQVARRLLASTVF